MEEAISIEKFIRAIQRLPSGKPHDHPKKWYKTQKEHWLGWLSEYHTPGAYGRQTIKTRDAKFAYNHVVEPEMLLWLIEAARVKEDLVAVVKREATKAESMMRQSAIIRRHIPWTVVAQALWPKTE